MAYILIKAELKDSYFSIISEEDFKELFSTLWEFVKIPD